MGIDVKLGPEAAWKATLGELELQMTKATFNSLLKGVTLAKVDVDGGKQRFIVHVRNDYARDWLESRLHETILRTLCAIMQEPVTIEYRTKSEFSMPPPPEMPPTTGEAKELQQANGSGNGNGESSGAESESGKGGLLAGNGRFTGNMPPVDSLRADQAFIGVVHGDPSYAQLQTAHYAHKFWRPLLGLIPFSLWEILRSYNYFVLNHGADWPSVNTISATLGYGDRYTILGRNATKTRPEQRGAIDTLVDYGICIYDSVGEGRQKKYYFLVQEQLPILTPCQVGQLPGVKQREHKHLLKRYKNFKIDGWETCTKSTFVQALTWEML